MEQTNDIFRMLEMLARPGFCVKDHKIIKAGSGAAELVAEGASIDDYLRTGREEYAEFTEGCLYLTLKLNGKSCGASVRRIGQYDLFMLEQDADQSELQAMALAARELREPLANVMTTADRLFPMSALQDDPAAQDLATRMNRGLYQMLRVISNMSDASRYSSASSVQESRNVPGLLGEIFVKAQTQVVHTGIRLTFENLKEPVFSLVDEEQLTRAVLNIISNAVKFSPKDGAIEAKLVRRGNMLHLTVLDSGEGLSEAVRSNIYDRFRRKPTIEDGRFGIGLGMVLIRSAATHHGGTVLVDKPSGAGTRITMTLAIRKGDDSQLRSQICKIDYAGGRDRTLIELSECLPPDAYESRKIN